MGAIILRRWAVRVLLLGCGCGCGYGCKRADPTPAPFIVQNDASLAAKASDKVLESCDQRPELGVCIEYTKSDVALHRTLCEGYKGTFGAHPCSSERQLGACAMEDGEFKRYYEKSGPKSPGYLLEQARINCESELIRGKFVAR